MSFDEALKVLGIEVSAGEDGARRAYLRLIRVHKPDRDPQGFQRVREAYDRVKGEIVWRARWAAAAEEDDAPDAEAIDEDAKEAKEAKEAAEGPVEPPVESPEVDSAAPDHHESAHAPASMAFYPANRRQDVADIPLESLKISERPRDIHIEAHAPMILQVNERPGLHFAESVIEGLRVVPRPDLPAETARAKPAPTQWPAELMDRARARIEAADFGGVVDALAAYEAARLRPEAPDPDAHTALYLVLFLFGQGRRHDGRRVFEALRAWLRATGSERRLMGGQTAARLAVARSLADLPADTPELPMQVIAVATLDGALEAAHAPLRAFAAESPFSATVAAEHFEAHAPLLATTFGASLRSAGSVAQAKPKKAGGDWSVWLLVVVALYAIRALSTCASSNQPSAAFRYIPPPSYSVPSLPPISIPTFQMPAISVPSLTIPDLKDLRINPLSGRAERMCQAAIAQKVAVFCELLREAAAAAGDRDCPRVDAALGQLADATKAQRQRLPRDYRLFQRNVRAACARPAEVIPVDSPPKPKQNAPVESSEDP
jgi:hypothetical protein